MKRLPAECTQRQTPVLGTNLSSSGGALHWENYLQTCRPSSLSVGLSTRIPNGSIFLLSQGIALVVALSNGVSTFSNQELVFTALSVGSVVITARNLLSLQP
jgi:hypothetical protein